MDVAADAVVLAADDQGRLAVRLQPDHAVDDVDPGLLEGAGLDDVVLLVEPGLELDQRGHLLAVLGGAGQGGDDRVVVGGPVERLLDRQDLRVVGRLLDELDDRAERLVGVVDQDVLLADGGEDVRAVGQNWAGICGSYGGSFSSRKPSSRQRATSAVRSTGPGTL